MIKELSADYSIRVLCQVLGVARSGYYGWSPGQASVRSLANAQLLEQIKTIHQAKRGNYGSLASRRNCVRMGRNVTTRKWRD